MMCVWSLQMGSSTHEGVKVPFQLPPGTANECQLVFYVKSFLMPQKLRGTVTYMAKVRTTFYPCLLNWFNLFTLKPTRVSRALPVTNWISPSTCPAPPSYAPYPVPSKTQPVTHLVQCSCVVEVMWYVMVCVFLL